MTDLGKHSTNQKPIQLTGLMKSKQFSDIKFLQISIYLGNGMLTLFVKAVLAMEWPLDPLDPSDPLDWARNVRKPPSANSRSVSSAGITIPSIRNERNERNEPVDSTVNLVALVCFNIPKKTDKGVQT